MVEAAQAHGFEATEALLEDWIKKGLIGLAERSGLGRGRGSIAWWSAAQFTLFIELLRARKQGKYRIRHLCAIPVWRWVYWGEQGGVELPQVKRVMETWVAFVKKTTAEGERKEARKAVEKLQGPGSSGKLALISELEAIGSFQREADPEILRYLFEAVVADSTIDVPSDLGDIRSVDIQMLSTMFPLRLRAFQQYEQIACLPDVLWKWARTFLLYLQLQAQRVQPRFAQHPRFAGRYRRLTVYDVLWGSCLPSALEAYFRRNLGGQRSTLLGNNCTIIHTYLLSAQ
jgi:hypothetical protein